MDGNLGLSAAISEMLVQSHAMGLIHLLPALPFNEIPSGAIKGFVTRGNIEVCLKWRLGQITATKLYLQQSHPWWSPYTEVLPGFYQPADADSMDSQNKAMNKANNIRVISSVKLQYAKHEGERDRKSVV